MFHVKHEIAEKNLNLSFGEAVAQLYIRHEDQLEEYISQLLWWNERINLVSRNVSRETLSEHVVHSLTLAGMESFSSHDSIIDTGTGGGLPGIPLSIVSPEKSLLFNDVVSKKVVAVKQMALKLKLKNADYYSSSIESLAFSSGSLIVSKHAFKINDLVRMLGDKDWSSILLLKGYSEIEPELEGLENALKIDVYKLDKVFDQEFYQGKGIVEIKRLEKE